MAEKTVKSRTVFDKNLSGWSKDQPPINPALESDVDADVAVIGGGYTGLSAAYHINNAVDTQAPFTYT